jgi:predicted Zn-dependent peptidase
MRKTLAGLAVIITAFEKKVTLKTLANGLTVLVCERPEAPVFSFFTHVDVGGDREVPGLPTAPKPAPLRTVEPPQKAERQVVLKDAAQPFYLEGYHRPAFDDPDDPSTTCPRTCSRAGAPRGSTARWCGTRRSPRPRPASAASRE